MPLPILPPPHPYKRVGNRRPLLLGGFGRRILFIRMQLFILAFILWRSPGGPPVKLADHQPIGEDEKQGSDDDEDNPEKHSLFDLINRESLREGLICSLTYTLPPLRIAVEIVCRAAPYGVRPSPSLQRRASKIP